MIYNRELEKVSTEDFKALGKVLKGFGQEGRPNA